MTTPEPAAVPDRVWVRNTSLGADPAAVSWIPNTDSVIEAFTAKGFEIVDAPEVAAAAVEWVDPEPGEAFTTWTHPVTKGEAKFPNNADGAAAARSMGWVHPSETPKARKGRAVAADPAPDPQA